MTDPTNADLYSVLLDIKGDIGGLKATSKLQLEGLKSHGARLKVLEDGAARQKGAAKVWALVGSALGAAIGGTAAILTAWMKH